MKREIKFRVWNKNKKQFIQLNEPINLNDFYDGYSHLIFMQYTGKKDKNGKEIYEGDIVNSGSPDNKVKWIVVWDEGSAQFGLKSPGAEIMIKRLEGRTYRLPEYSMRLLYGTEVIGNIYENKELIQETFTST